MLLPSQQKQDCVQRRKSFEAEYSTLADPHLRHWLRAGSPQAKSTRRLARWVASPASQYGVRASLGLSTGAQQLVNNMGGSDLVRTTPPVSGAGAGDAAESVGAPRTADLPLRAVLGLRWTRLRPLSAPPPPAGEDAGARSADPGPASPTGSASGVAAVVDSWAAGELPTPQQRRRRPATAGRRRAAASPARSSASSRGEVQLFVSPLSAAHPPPKSHPPQPAGLVSPRPAAPAPQRRGQGQRGLRSEEGSEGGVGLCEQLAAASFAPAPEEEEALVQQRWVARLAELKVLWRDLLVPRRDRDAFAAQWCRRITPAAMRRVDAELRRLRVLREGAQRIGAAVRRREELLASLREMPERARELRKLKGGGELVTDGLTRGVQQLREAACDICDAYVQFAAAMGDRGPPLTPPRLRWAGSENYLAHMQTDLSEPPEFQELLETHIGDTVVGNPLLRSSGEAVGERVLRAEQLLRTDNNRHAIAARRRAEDAVRAVAEKAAGAIQRTYRGYRGRKEAQNRRRLRKEAAAEAQSRKQSKAAAARRKSQKARKSPGQVPHGARGRASVTVQSPSSDPAANATSPGSHPSPASPGSPLDSDRSSQFSDRAEEEPAPWLHATQRLPQLAAARRAADLKRQLQRRRRTVQLPRAPAWCSCGRRRGAARTARAHSLALQLLIAPTPLYWLNPSTVGGAAPDPDPDSTWLAATAGSEFAVLRSTSAIAGARRASAPTASPNKDTQSVLDLPVPGATSILEFPADLIMDDADAESSSGAPERPSLLMQRLRMAAAPVRGGCGLARERRDARAARRREQRYCALAAVRDTIRQLLGRPPLPWPPGKRAPSPRHRGSIIDPSRRQSSMAPDESLRRQGSEALPLGGHLPETSSPAGRMQFGALLPTAEAVVTEPKVRSVRYTPLPTSPRSFLGLRRWPEGCAWATAPRLALCLLPPPFRLGPSAPIAATAAAVITVATVLGVRQQRRPSRFQGGALGGSRNRSQTIAASPGAVRSPQRPTSGLPAYAKRKVPTSPRAKAQAARAAEDQKKATRARQLQFADQAASTAGSQPSAGESGAAGPLATGQFDFAPRGVQSPPMVKPCPGDKSWPVFPVRWLPTVPHLRFARLLPQGLPDREEGDEEEEAAGASPADSAAGPAPPPYCAPHRPPALYRAHGVRKPTRDAPARFRRPPLRPRVGTQEDPESVQEPLRDSGSAAEDESGWSGPCSPVSRCSGGSDESRGTRFSVCSTALLVPQRPRASVRPAFRLSVRAAVLRVLAGHRRRPRPTQLSKRRERAALRIQTRWRGCSARTAHKERMRRRREEEAELSLAKLRQEQAEATVVLQRWWRRLPRAEANQGRSCGGERDLLALLLQAAASAEAGRNAPDGATPDHRRAGPYPWLRACAALGSAPGPADDDAWTPFPPSHEQHVQQQAEDSGSENIIEVQTVGEPTPSPAMTFTDD